MDIPYDTTPRKWESWEKFDRSVSWMSDMTLSQRRTF